MKVTKTLSIKEFIDLWKNVISGKWDDIAPNLGKEIRKIWGDEIMMRFEESKGAGSYGDYGGSQNLALLLKTDSGPGARIAYTEAYDK